MDNLFKEIALPLVLKYEGGFTDHPLDKGGATNKGIIQSEYDAYRKEKKLNCQSVKFISQEEVEYIYFNKYWLKAKCEQMPKKVAVIHFDTSVNTGVKQAAKFLQRSVKVEDDGAVGKITLEAVNKLDQEMIITSYLDQRKSFYEYLVEKNPTQKVFLNGWLNRISNLKIVVCKI